LFWSNPDGDRQPYGVLEPRERRSQHTFAGHVWVATTADGEVLAVFEAADKPAQAVIDGKAPKGEVGEVARRVADSVRRRREGGWRARPLRSPDGKHEAFVRGDNLWVREVESGQEVQLSTDAGEKETYSRDVYRDRAEGGGGRDDLPAESPSEVPEAYWSPDSKKLVAIRTRRAPGHTVYLIESSPKDQVQPKLHSMQYLKPGDEIPVQKPHLFDVENRKEIPVKDELFPSPWSVGEFRWKADLSRFTFLYNQRGHQALRVVAVDATSGEARPIVDEKSDTFIDYSGKMFCEYLDDTGEIVWMSERDGWNHLYLYDADTGAVKNQITRGEWVVRGVDKVDKEKRQVWFRAGGVRSGQDPYQVHLCRVNLDGTGLVVLTEGDGTHAVQFSPDRKFFIDTWSRVDLPPRSELRRSEDGSLVCKLEEADAADLASAGQSFPERFVAKGRDGTTDIYGVILRPRGFDPSRHYPVVESIYAGPQDAYVPKSFRPSSRQQELADRGYVVVQIDGMGTSQRSKKFHDVCWKNLADAGFPDRIPWIRAAAAKYPQMDLSRVGIYGGSAGGQNALGALLLHGDFYKVAVADCGCHDNRMDKIWWNEQWMGYPVGPHYAEQSNVTLAPNLKGKLMLIVGELDRNVDPASTMQVVNALVKADKDFDLLVVPGANHGAGSTRYGWRRTTDFLARHLLNGGSDHPTDASASAAQ
jgi:dipeptidyl aminopeptidase/acylaminoacyl peptidase